MADVLVNGNGEESKIVALNLVMKNNLLFSEFVKEVYLAKSKAKEKSITKTDIAEFFERKKKQSPVVASWKPYVFRKLGQVYINSLYNVGLLKCALRRNKSSIEINKSKIKYIKNNAID
ncbi:BrxA family protein [Anaeromicrobium sediminis]|nr:BrxA family protein [Anaeromicrobium sediminis]